MYVRGFSEDERCCVQGIYLQHADVWGKNLGDESSGVSEAASHREKNAEHDLWSDVEG